MPSKLLLCPKLIFHITIILFTARQSFYRPAMPRIIRMCGNSQMPRIPSLPGCPKIKKRDCKTASFHGITIHIVLYEYPYYLYSSIPLSLFGYPSFREMHTLPHGRISGDASQKNPYDNSSGSRRSSGHLPLPTTRRGTSCWKSCRCKHLVRRHIRLHRPYPQ